MVKLEISISNIVLLVSSIFIEKFIKNVDLF